MVGALRFLGPRSRFSVVGWSAQARYLPHMVTSRKHLRMSEAEYLEYDRTHEGKYEYINGEVIPWNEGWDDVSGQFVAMAGATEAHNTIQANVMISVGGQLRGKPCRIYGSDQRVYVDGTGAYVYPDASIVCGERLLTRTAVESLLNPRVVFEVLSRSTAAHDLMAKAAHYRLRPSIEAIVFVDSLWKHVQVQTRNSNGTWTLDELTEGNIQLPEIGVTLSIDELYAGWTPPSDA